MTDIAKKNQFYLDEMKECFMEAVSRGDREAQDIILNDIKLSGGKLYNDLSEGCFKFGMNLETPMRQYARIAEYGNVENLLENIINCKSGKYILPNGKSVKPSSLRYQLFYKSRRCVKCGRVGNMLALERDRNNTNKTYHLNLYCVEPDGTEVLMTKDHIVPKAKGGPDTLENMQCMCKICNEAKADVLDGEVPYGQLSLDLGSLDIEEQSSLDEKTSGACSYILDLISMFKKEKEDMFRIFGEDGLKIWISNKDTRHMIRRYNKQYCIKFKGLNIPLEYCGSREELITRMKEAYDLWKK